MTFPSLLSWLFLYWYNHRGCSWKFVIWHCCKFIIFGSLIPLSSYLLYYFLNYISKFSSVFIQNSFFYIPCLIIFLFLHSILSWKKSFWLYKIKEHKIFFLLNYFNKSFYNKIEFICNITLFYYSISFQENHHFNMLKKKENLIFILFKKVSIPN